MSDRKKCTRFRYQTKARKQFRLNYHLRIGEGGRGRRRWWLWAWLSEKETENHRKQWKGPCAFPSETLPNGDVLPNCFLYKRVASLMFRDSTMFSDSRNLSQNNLQAQRHVQEGRFWLPPPVRGEGLSWHIYCDMCIVTLKTETKVIQKNLPPHSHKL